MGSEGNLLPKSPTPTPVTTLRKTRNASLSFRLPLLLMQLKQLTVKQVWKKKPPFISRKRPMPSCRRRGIRERLLLHLAGDDRVNSRPR